MVEELPVAIRANSVKSLSLPWHRLRKAVNNFLLLSAAVLW